MPPWAVYPRVCGGTCRLPLVVLVVSGLSPRVRGNLTPAYCGIRIPRSIPACAGEPMRFRRTGTIAEVYPRVCGGTTLRHSQGGLVCGLSPRVRGNPVIAAMSAHVHRSIPACAGEPYALPIESTRNRVYPRVCGGTWPSQQPPLRLRGLSPRVRGNPMPRRKSYASGGSIPACAGEPDCRAMCSSSIKVYPRVCGGTPRCSPRLGVLVGLSPRVRGNLLHCDVDGPSTGSIPACAGEPSLS